MRRGAADLEAITSLGPVVSGPYGYLKNVEGTLRALDAVDPSAADPGNPSPRDA